MFRMLSIPIICEHCNWRCLKLGGFRVTTVLHEVGFFTTKVFQTCTHHLFVVAIRIEINCSIFVVQFALVTAKVQCFIYHNHLAGFYVSRCKKSKSTCYVISLYLNTSSIRNEILTFFVWFIFGVLAHVCIIALTLHLYNLAKAKVVRILLQEEILVNFFAFCSFNQYLVLIKPFQIHESFCFDLNCNVMTWYHR